LQNLCDRVVVFSEAEVLATRGGTMSYDADENGTSDNADASPGEQRAIAPGWFADPDGSQQSRYWDGSAWTHHVSAGATLSQPVDLDGSAAQHCLEDARR
jgi:hypothetical protein